MISNDALTRSMMLIAVACALVTTGLVVRRELFSPKRNGSGVNPRPVSDWQKYVAGGQLIGSATAAVKVIEFTDYQCPFCRRFAVTTWPAVRREFGDNVTLVVRHWPLEQHKHALPAARAAECAGAQGRFEQFHDLLFAKQDSIGKIAYTAFAQASGVPDLEAFQACASKRDQVKSIEDGIAAARSLRATGTPTVIINGFLLPAPLDSTRLKQLVRTRSIGVGDDHSIPQPVAHRFTPGVRSGRHRIRFSADAQAL
jgi:protein-disulfide isomerase